MGTEMKRILVVDDEESVRNYLRMVLEDAGFEVIIATDGFEALDEVEKSSPDLISLDLVMPKRSGIKFYKDLQSKAQWRSIPVLIVTGHARDDLGREDFEELTISGPGFYLEKPVKPGDYVNAVKKMLGMTEDEFNSESEMRKKLANALAGADAETLKKALEVIDRKKA